jgi:hypothetical protein
MWLPIVGWLISSWLMRRRLSVFTQAIERQLAARIRFPEEEWGCDGQRLEFVRFVCRTLKTEVGWPNDHFVPDDPVWLLVGGYGDCLLPASIAIEIERYLDVRVAEKDWEATDGMTLGQAVAYLHGLPQRLGDQL